MWVWVMIYKLLVPWNQGIIVSDATWITRQNQGVIFIWEKVDFLKKKIKTLTSVFLFNENFDLVFQKIFLISSLF